MFIHMTFTPTEAGWFNVTSPAIPDITITLAPPLLPDDEGDTLGNWTSTVRGSDGRCLTHPLMVELAEISINHINA